MSEKPAPADRPRVAPRFAEDPVTDRITTLLGARLRWLIGIRLVVITSVLLPYFLLQLASSGGLTFDFLYLLCGATYVASLGYIALLKLLVGRPALQAYIQFSGDLLLVSGLVYYFGGTSSPFSILYLIVIIVAAILLQRRAGLIVATLAWLLYAGVALWLHVITRLATPFTAFGFDQTPTSWRLAYYLAVHLFGFYAVALMTSRLAQTVTQAESELKAKRADLAALQVAYRDVIQSIPSGLITTDRDGVVTSVNRAGEEILDKAEANLIGRPIHHSGLFSWEDWRLLGQLGPEEAGRARREVEYGHGAESRQLGYGLTALTTADGTPCGYIVIFQDLSEWRKLQEELRLKDRMAAVGQLASGLAHEIGNPLAAISGSVQMLSHSFEGEPQQGKLLNIINKESQRLNRTIKSFLKFARPMERSLVHFDISAQLAENMELLRNSAEVSDAHELIVDVWPSSLSILADPDQISQIFWNLARNAIRAMPDGGSLRVEGTLKDSTYRINFRDTGKGMSEEERANLFHPFRSSFDGGTGIGMAIVYQIVQEHGGRLKVTSRPGVGSEITVELPVEAEIGADRTMEA